MPVSSVDAQSASQDQSVAVQGKTRGCIARVHNITTNSMRLLQYLQELRNLPEEELIQPELKQHRQEQDQKIRENQDLADGAVLQAEIEPGEGTSSPSEGDLVFVHVSINTADGDERLYSTRSDEGGNGQPIAFILGKGAARAPRCWELALVGMHAGGRVALKARPSYGYHHPLCNMQPPPGVKTDQALSFDMQLVSWTQARSCGTTGVLYKRVLQEGSSWESARAPFEATFHVVLRLLAYDGVPQSGKVLHSTFDHTCSAPAKSPADATSNPGTPLTVTLGSGQLPKGVEEALSHMCKGEHALFIMPASWVNAPVKSDSTSAQRQQAGALLPTPPENAQQVEVELQLLSVVQVRDMTGDGQVMKRRLREGQGEFPIDCPLNDTTVRVHYRVRGIHHGARGPWLLGTRHSAQQDASRDDHATVAGAAEEGIAALPLEIDTGCGEAPEALEMCAKLMVPGEVALVTAHSHRYAYEGRDDNPDGLQGADAVEWEVELVSFDKEGHWQVMSMEERFSMAERVKAKANALVKAGKHAFAKARYERILRLMESTRDYETEEEMQKMDSYKLAVLLNLALCEIALNEPAQAITWCDKALQYDEKNAKAFFRRGRALSLKGDYDEAISDLQHAAELDASWAADVEKELAANSRRAKAAVAKQKSDFKNFFGR